MKTLNPTKSLGILAGVAALAGVPLSGNAQSLIDQWNFNETSGTTAANAVGGGASATLMGNATFNGSGAVTLDGSGGTYIDLGNGLLNGLSSVTFEGWFNTAGVNNTHLFAFDPGNPWGTYLRFNLGDTGNGHGGNDFLESIVGWGGNVLNGTPLTANTLLHVAVVFDPSSSYEAVYVNGALTASFSGALNPLSNYATFDGTLGRSPWWAQGDLNLTGTIDQFSIYNGALSAGQIATDFANGPTPVPEPSTFALAAGGLTLFGLIRRRNAR